MAITVSQIFAAADDLDSRGISPTLAAVRKALGAGSFTTISEAMAVWRTQRSAKIATAQEPLPAAIESVLSDLGRSVWDVAMAHANARLAAEREELTQARAQAVTAREEAVALADTVTLELDQTKAQLEEAGNHVRALEERFTQQAETLSTQAAANAGLTARVAELLNRIQDLSAELERGHIRNAELSAALSALANGQPDNKKPE